MDFNEIADIMGCSIRNAHHLIRCVWQKYPKPIKVHSKPEPVKQKRYCYDKKPADVIQEFTAPFKRPKAEYSNSRLYDLI